MNAHLEAWSGFLRAGASMIISYGARHAREWLAPMSTSDSLFERAKQVSPGGVHSPVRAFKGVGGTPRFMTGGSRRDASATSTAASCSTSAWPSGR